MRTLSKMIVSLPRCQISHFDDIEACSNARRLRFHTQRILSNIHKGIRSQLISTTYDRNLQTVPQFTRSRTILRRYFESVPLELA